MMLKATKRNKKLSLRSGSAQAGKYRQAFIRFARRGNVTPGIESPLS